MMSPARRSRFQNWRRRGYVCCIAALLAAAAAGQDRPTDYADWYLRHYGAAAAAGAEEAALVARAERVFARVRAVADRKAGRGPRLLVIDRRAGLGAQALPDGTIVLDPGLLRFCFGPTARPAAIGDARLAFVLGHEMAHLAYDDAWHARAFAAVTQAGDADLAAATAGWLEEPPAERQAKEVRADHAGFRFLLMAGYSADAILGGKDDFLAAWAGLADGDGAEYGPQHPSFPQRAKALRVEVARVAADLPFSRFGVRLLALGRVDDAIPLLERFRNTYPGREANTNLGLAHYERAMVRLADCGSEDGLRFRLTTLIDPTSLAARIHLRGDGDSICLEQARQGLHAARELLAEAHAQDPADLAARLDLAAVLIALRRGNEAYLATGLDRSSASGAAAAPADPRLLLAAAVALHVAREEVPFDTSTQAVEMLALAGRNPNTDAETSAAIAFNLARIEEERGRNSAAAAAWRAFLERESVGAWAEEARRYLGEAAPLAARVKSAARTPLAKRLPPSLAKALDRGRRIQHTLGATRIVFVLSEGVAALELDGVLELVEESLVPADGREALLARLGRPRATLITAPGRETRVYSDVAYDTEGGRAVAKVWF